MKLFLLFISLNILYDCNTFSKDNTSLINEITNANIKNIFNKPKNLVFIWTTCCGVSKNILKETYSVLQKDSKDYNIIVVCGNNAPESIEALYRQLDINLKMYIIKGASNNFPLFDKINIKKFITEEFTNGKDNSPEGYFFGIPITLFVDSNLNILNNDMPQDTTNIRNIILNYKL